MNIGLSLEAKDTQRQHLEVIGSVATDTTGLAGRPGPMVEAAATTTQTAHVLVAPHAKHDRHLRMGTDRSHIRLSSDGPTPLTHTTGRLTPW